MTGGCGCGAVRYEISAPFVAALYCHCTRCQRRTGTGASANGRIAPLRDQFAQLLRALRAEVVHRWVRIGRHDHALPRVLDIPELHAARIRASRIARRACYGRAMTTPAPTRTLGAVLYEDFELLDLYGPLEMFGSVGPSLRIVTVANAPGPVRSFQGPKTVAEHGFAISPDGTRVVTASGDRPARVWDATSGREISALRGDGGSVYSVAFSPDGMRIVTASGESDYKTQVWRATNGREITALRGHEGGVFHPWFSPDGTRLLNGVQVLDAANGREITALRGHEGSVSSVAFSPDGTRILTAANDGTARVWQVPASVRASRNELRVMACTGPLSHETSRFTSSEMREAPVLNPVLDTDVCAPPTLWMRLDAMLR